MDLLDKLKSNKQEAQDMCRYYEKLMRSYAEESQGLELAIAPLEAAVKALEDKLK